MKLALDKIIHLPDLLFVQWCEEKFGVNRGVYNTIDCWFYEKMVKDIVKRRLHILHFLHLQNRYDGEKVKFGHGGLATYLKGYWNNFNSTPEFGTEDFTPILLAESQ